MLKVVFMGTPDFAVPSAEMIRQNFDLLAVVTAPDKPAGRGRHLKTPPIKNWASSFEIPILQPKNLQSNVFLDKLRSFGADVYAVVAFRKLPPQVWEWPAKGCINLHASLLPQFRGAAPIQRAIEQGCTETGLTTFRITKEIDKGDILLQEKVAIAPDETAGQLHDRMKVLGAQLLKRTLLMIEKNDIAAVAQDDRLASYAPKISTDDARIKWEATNTQVYNQIRAFIPYPGPWFLKDGKKYKILKARKSDLLVGLAPGQWYRDNKQLFIGCGKGSIEILTIQAEGKKPMDVRAFLNGFRD